MGGDSSGCVVGDGVGGDSSGWEVGDGDGGVGVGGGRCQAINLKDFQTDLNTTPITTVALLATFPGLGNIRSAQQGDGDLKVIIDDLAKGGTPTSTHPGLKKFHWKENFPYPLVNGCHVLHFFQFVLPNTYQECLALVTRSGGVDRAELARQLHFPPPFAGESRPEKTSPKFIPQTKCCI